MEKGWEFCFSLPPQAHLGAGMVTGIPGKRGMWMHQSRTIGSPEPGGQRRQPMPRGGEVTRFSMGESRLRPYDQFPGENVQREQMVASQRFTITACPRFRLGP